MSGRHGPRMRMAADRDVIVRVISAHAPTPFAPTLLFPVVVKYLMEIIAPGRGK